METLIYISISGTPLHRFRFCSGVQNPPRSGAAEARVPGRCLTPHPSLGRGVGLPLGTFTLTALGGCKRGRVTMKPHAQAPPWCLDTGATAPPRPERRRGRDEPPRTHTCLPPPGPAAPPRGWGRPYRGAYALCARHASTYGICATGALSGAPPALTTLRRIRKKH